jgi:hypothetical protein
MSAIRLNPRIGKSPLLIASASSRRERALLAEQPALLNLAVDNRLMALGSRRPPAISVTRALIVRAAFVESCCERMDLAKDSKLLDFGR